MKTCILPFFMLISGFGFSQTQVFPQMGQLPSNAFPLCGLDTFRQLIIPYGTGGFIDIPGCGQLETLNPYYYSFTCYSGGSLAILVDPIDPLQDYNWELFDITGHDPNEIYTNNSLAVIGNWSGRYGRTGAINHGAPSTLCLSSPTVNDSTFSETPVLILGHHYLLLVSGYSKTQSDYFLSFSGSTALITDPLTPHMQTASFGCNKKTITIVTNKQIRCNSLTTDGSGFLITPGTVSVTAASGINCNDQFDFDSLRLTLSDSLAPGNYIISTRPGSNGYVLWDNCFHEIPVGDMVSFTVFPTETVSADFSYQINYGCQYDTSFFYSPAAHTTFQSIWLIDSVFVSSRYEPVIVDSVFGPMQVQHIVSNGTCSDTVTKIINLDNFLKASMNSPPTVCPKDLVLFEDKSIGNIIHWNWNFGDGTFTDQQEPPAHAFPEGNSEKKYLISLVVENTLGCFDTTTALLTKFQSCSVAVPNAFTPNGDGKNDYLFPLNAFVVKDLEFMVFNRLGQLIFETRDPFGKWDGSIHGIAQPAGVYIWTFRYTDGPTGKKVFFRGTTVLIR